MYFYFICRHANTAVANGDGLCLFINCNFDMQVTEFFIKMPQRTKPLEFLCGIHSVTHQLTKKDLVIAV